MVKLGEKKFVGNLPIECNVTPKDTVIIEGNYFVFGDIIFLRGDLLIEKISSGEVFPVDLDQEKPELKNYLQKIINEKSAEAVNG